MAKDGVTPPRSGDADSLAERLSKGDAPVAPKKPRRTKAQRRVLIGRIARWTGTGLAGLGALVLFAMAGSISSYHTNEMVEQYTSVTDQENRLRAASQAERELPEGQQGSRNLDAALGSAKTVSDIQNIYLTETGPVSLDGIPTAEVQTGREPDDDEYICSEPAPGTRAKTYTEEERLECAERRRADVLSGQGRKLETYFAQSALDQSGFTAATPWHESVPTLPDAKTTTLKGYTWTPSSEAVFDEHGNISVTWTLSDDKGATAALLTGVYDPVSKKFGSLTLAVAEGDES